MIWLAWFNGTVIYDLHGREDIRTRSYTFVQMLLVVLLSVYVGDAAGDDGRGFALVYATFVALLVWLFYTVRRQDEERFRDMTGRYLSLMSVATLVMLASALLSNETRVVVWAVLVAAWLVTLLVLGRGAESMTEESFIVTESIVERFGLFTIIVLGEVVVGVVDGLSEAENDLETVATGLIALVIGFGLWWNYFDLAGRRLPREDPSGSPVWMVSHLPLTMAIAAAGAAMLSLIENASANQTPAATAWLLSGSTALGLVALIVIVRSLKEYRRLSQVYRPTSVVMIAGAASALLLGLWRPAPLLVALLLVAIQTVVWLFAVIRWLELQESG